ncbi:MAG: glycosyltransferase family 39 protein [Chloroflexota bacterium]
MKSSLTGTSQPATSATGRVALYLIVALYLVTATVYNVTIPVGEAPDEADHIRYVEIVLKTGQLPTIPKDSPRYSYEAEQPPLYYLMQAAWMRLLWPNSTLLPDLQLNPDFSADTNFSFERGTPLNVFLHNYPSARDTPVHLMRLFSTLLGLLTLLLIWMAARRALHNSEAPAIIATGFVAFLPGFTFTSATVSNDSLAATAGAAILLASIYMLQCGPTAQAALLNGLATGLGMLSKRSLLVMLPVIALVPFLTTSSTRRQRIQSASLSVVVALLLGVWSLVANVITYGDPFATAATLAAKAEIVSPLQGRPGYWLSVPYHLALYNSLWGAFGIRNIDLPNLLYAFYYILCLLALVGFIRRRKDLFTSDPPLLLLLVVTFLLVNAGVAYQNTQFWAVQGRLLLPAVPALALGVAFGLSLVARDILPTRRVSAISLGVLLIIFLLLDWYALIQFIIYVYYA